MSIKSNAARRDVIQPVDLARSPPLYANYFSMNKLVKGLLTAVHIMGEIIEHVPKHLNGIDAQLRRFAVQEGQGKQQPQSKRLKLPLSKIRLPYFRR